MERTLSRVEQARRDEQELRRGRRPADQALCVSRGDLRGLRALVVDDNATNRRILQKHLSSWGAEEGYSADGPGALRELRSATAAGRPYDLALLDMHMPGMDGVELAGRIKADPAVAATRLVMLTSAGRRGDAERAGRAGVEAYLAKPVRQAELRGVLAAVVGPPAERQAEPALGRATVVVPSPEEHAGTDRGARILLAEDNAVNQRVAVKMLERLGYRADVATNGLEAVEALFRAPYAAVLMDVQMPEMDGYEATKEIRRREGAARRTPIIAMTANAMLGDREKALEAGMDDHLPKPVKSAELGAILERWVSEDDETAAVPAGGHEPPAAEVEAPLDASVVEGLRELGGDEILSELTTMFIDDAVSNIALLKEAAASGDAGSVETAAHTLKGSSGNMGAKTMAKICAQLQDAGASNELSSVSELLEGLQAELGHARPALLALGS